MRISDPQSQSEHFIKLREVRIGHLDKTTALELLTQPIAKFLPQAILATVTETIFTRSGWRITVHLLQRYIEHLNAKKRKYCPYTIPRQ